MRTTIQEIYKCDHCNKLYQRRYACEIHEICCTKNPENHRPCYSCPVIEKVKETIWSGVGDYWGNELEKVVDVLFCKKHDCFIYPPSVGYKGNAFDMGDKQNIEMPKECEYHVAHEQQEEFNSLFIF